MGVKKVRSVSLCYLKERQKEKVRLWDVRRVKLPKALGFHFAPSARRSGPPNLISVKPAY